MEIGLNHFLLVSACLFAIGTGLVITRRNAVMVLMGLELIINAAAVNFVAFSRFVPSVRQHLTGDATAIFAIVIAAAEAAVALAIVLNLYNTFSTINVDEIDTLKE